MSKLCLSICSDNLKRVALWQQLSLLLLCALANNGGDEHLQLALSSPDCERLNCTRFVSHGHTAALRWHKHQLNVCMLWVYYA
jgi:hypothetical protein